MQPSPKSSSLPGGLGCVTFHFSDSFLMPKVEIKQPLPLGLGVELVSNG